MLCTDKVMDNNRNDRIGGLITRLLDETAMARELGLSDTVNILSIAILELKTVLHRISDDEIRTFTETVAERLYQTTREPDDKKIVVGGRD